MPGPAEVIRVGVVRGQLEPEISATYPFDAAADALAAVESGHARGKIVLDVAGVSVSENDAATTDREQAGRTAVIVAGRVFVPPDDVETFVAEARATYPVAAANPGNVLISFCVEDPAAGAVTVLEQWTSQDALDRHLSTPQVVALFTRWSPHMRNEVRKFDALNERDPRA